MTSLLWLVLLLGSQDAEFRAGVEAYRTGNYAAAAGRFEESIRQKETADAWAHLGHARAALRENGAARKAYERALALGATDRARLSLGLGRVLLLDNGAAEAVDALAPALDSAETAGDAWLLTGQAREQLGHRTLAVEAYRQAAARQPRNAALRARLAHLLLELQRGAEAMDVARSLVAESPANADWRLLLAQTALRASDADEAETSLDAARLLGADRPSLYRTLGDLLLSQNRGREAASHYRRYLASEERVAPDDRMRLGMALLQGGELAAAEAALRRAASENDACRRGLLALARALAEKRGVAPALAAMEAVPSDSAVFGASRLLKAQILLKDGRPKEALAAMHEAWDKGERGRDFLLSYLRLLPDGEHRDRRKAVRTEALALYPEEPRILESSGSEP